MRLQKLSAFISHYFERPRPSPRTAQKWPGARKIGGEWYIDIDIWLASIEVEALTETLIKDPEVAALVGTE